jgi:L-seryl-tRNA(Ser) seleniumtransferase
MAMPTVRDGDPTRADLFRMLPSVNDLLLTPRFQELLPAYSRSSIVTATRTELSIVRNEIFSGAHTQHTLEERLEAIHDQVSARVASDISFSLRPLINATGVILHTNLGRSPLSAAALDHVVEVAQDYCNLEFDLETGLRSKRDVHAESLLLRILESGSTSEQHPQGYGAVIVNNCAAATFLALNSLAAGREVIVSRGELVEIGGGFRIPEILEKSGASLKEVGTTNKTRIADYERAISANTALILRVHQSNFSMDGFVDRSELSGLAALAKRAGVPLFEDQGTGLVSSLEDYGIIGEATLSESFKHGVDLIAASGDKLLGGPQCGILVGKADVIAHIRMNPLLRTFRVDKLIYAALEATLTGYLSNRAESIPIFRMLSIPPRDVRARCENIANALASPRFPVEISRVMSVVGGGTAPRAQVPSFALALQHATLTASELLASLRSADPPIIGRISDETVLLDLRTVPPRLDTAITTTLSTL